MGCGVRFIYIFISVVLSNIALHSIALASALEHKEGVVVHSHTVIAGDTLWDLSKKYLGNPLNYTQIKQANNIDSEYALQPGQELQFISARFYPGIVTGVTGQAYSLSGTAKKPLRKGFIIEQGSLIQALEQSFVNLQFMNQVEVAIAPNSVVLFHSAAQVQSAQLTPQLELQQGAAEFQVPALQSDYNKLEVLTPYLTLGVRGTHFRVKHADGVMLSEVLSGQVVLTQEQQQLAQINPGEGAVFNAQTQHLTHEKIAPQPRIYKVSRDQQGLNFEFVQRDVAAYKVKIYNDADYSVPVYELTRSKSSFSISAQHAVQGMYYVSITSLSPSGIESYPLRYQSQGDEVLVQSVPQGVEFTFPYCDTQWRVQLAESERFLIPAIDRTEKNVCTMLIKNLPSITWYWRVFEGNQPIDMAAGQVSLIEKQ